ncbi:hypothetical protein POTOM_005969 [Populus tomentosa]|uniref:Histone deacetylase interacting domain-containing protein n=1 Tax=Populus tomentosa TaxID=118781 RepID=A0A8X8AK59_POPTO|nr:hypothetical protein POTOM_005969 [Populus tomentosa]
MDTAAAHDGLVGGLTVVLENFSARVKEILGGNHDLIGGLNSFLRPEFQINLDVEEKKETEPAMETLLKNFRLRKEGSMSLIDVCDFGHRVTEGHPDLLLDFLYSMPITEATSLAYYLPGLESSELRNCRVDELQKESSESFEVCGRNRESEFVKAGGSQVKGGSHYNEEEKETETTRESKTFRQGSRSLVDVFDSGLKLTEGHGDLPKDFIKFMPLSELEKPLAYHLSDLLSTDLTNTRAADVPQKKRQNDKEAKLIMGDEAEVKASDSEAEKIREGIGFFEKVKKRLPCAMSHKTFLKLFFYYSKGKIGKAELVKMVANLIGNYPDLISDFYNFWRNCESVNVLEVRGCKARDRRRQKQSREELDFSRCKRCTPRRRFPNHHERNVFKCADEQYELDMLVEWFKSAVIYAEEMGGGTVKNKGNNMTGRIFLRCIERLYGDQGLEILDMFDKDPQRALPVLRLRLQKKLEELIRYRQSFEKHHG